MKPSQLHSAVAIALLAAADVYLDYDAINRTDKKIAAYKLTSSPKTQSLNPSCSSDERSYEFQFDREQDILSEACLQYTIVIMTF